MWQLESRGREVAGSSPVSTGGGVIVRCVMAPAKCTGKDGPSAQGHQRGPRSRPGRERSPAPVSGAARVGLSGAHPFGTAVPTTQVLLAPVFLSLARDSGTRGER